MRCRRAGDRLRGSGASHRFEERVARAMVRRGRHGNEAHSRVTLACQNDLVSGLGAADEVRQLSYGFTHRDSHGRSR